MMRRRCAVSGQHASDVVRWITTKKPTQVRSYHARAPSSHESFRGIFLEPKGTSRPPMLAGTQIYEREILDYNHPRVAGVTSYVKAYVGVRLTFLTAGYATIAYATRPHHILPCHPMDRPVLEAYLQSKLVQAPLPVIHTLGSERDFEYLDYVATPRALEKLGEITDDALLSAGCSSDDGNGNGNGDGDDGNCDGDVEHGDGGRPRFDEEQRKKILSVMKDLSLLEVLELLEMCQEVPDEHIIVAAWQRLAAFCRNNDQILDQVLSDPSFNHFYTILTPSSFSSFLSLVGFIEANVAMGLGEDHRLVPFLREAVTRARAMSAMSEEEAVRFSLALTRTPMRRQRNVFEAVAQKTAPQISSYSVEGLSGLLFSLSLAGVRDKSTYEIAQGRLLAHMRKGGSLGFSSLPRVITAYARAVDSLGLPAYELLDWLEVEAVKKIDTMGPTLVCDVL